MSKILKSNQTGYVIIINKNNNAIIALLLLLFITFKIVVVVIVTIIYKICSLKKASFWTFVTFDISVTKLSKINNLVRYQK